MQPSSADVPYFTVYFLTSLATCHNHATSTQQHMSCMQRPTIHSIQQLLVVITCSFMRDTVSRWKTNSVLW